MLARPEILDIQIKFQSLDLGRFPSWNLALVDKVVGNESSPENKKLCPRIVEQSILLVKFNLEGVSLFKVQIGWGSGVYYCVRRA